MWNHFSCKYLVLWSGTEFTTWPFPQGGKDFRVKDGLSQMVAGWERTVAVRCLKR